MHEPTAISIMYYVFLTGASPYEDSSAPNMFFRILPFMQYVIQLSVNVNDLQSCEAESAQ